ncbi:uncharacterized protein LOC129772923 [Toxorhynchites rutilus septentrionalis]|uniref:uncharacterized protein LOC129772923 n=1 Tax=Toxorhynchites rutilus septentrionalis TaxID=329112 RepID=UPI0024785477|nr:uncharacterized protein LOC129772923 [Toxorhynchites rutilus septentrionalis]
MAQNENDSQVQRNCALCVESDDYDDMVACDSCQLWHHYSCAKVSPNVKDRKWNCPTCEPSCKDGSKDVLKNDGGNKTNPKRLVSDVCPSKSNAKGAKPNIPAKQPDALEVPKKTMAKSTAGSKISKRSKKMVDDSVTSSTRARLELELKALEEQQRIQEEDLAEKKKLKDLHQKLEEELREKELAIEVRRIAQAKVALEQKMADESEFRRQQMAIRKHSAEEKVKLIRQASQYGSSHGSRASGGISVTWN